MEKKSMVQKEVKKKTTAYGTAAILMAVILISMVYTFGSISPNLPSSQTPSDQNPVSNTSPMPRSTIIPISSSSTTSGLKTFTSLEELKNYIGNASQAEYYGGNTLGMQKSAPVPAPQATGIYYTTSDYSTTNIQVAGVDEADTVKTDGEYIYTLSTPASPYYDFNSQTSSNVYIVSADPQNAQIISKIPLDTSLMPVGLFLSQDSTRLAVLANKYTYNSAATSSPSNIMIMPFYSYQTTTVNIYDISNKVNPILTRNFTVSGSYFNSRMIGNYLYAVTSQSATVYNNLVTVPAVYNGEVAYAASPTSIYYADMNQSNFYSFTSFYGINIMNSQQPPANMTVLMSGASTMYVSSSNIYVAYPNWANGTDFTSIYRVKINGLQLTLEAQGNVPGYVVDQYSMDEYNSNLRVATTLYQYISVQQQSSQTNNVYVLNQNLTVIGKAEGIGQGENLHAVRFMDDRGYMVTFIKTDPLFVIDLSQPSNPKVLGELQIPGYSDYLHPYDSTHLIGVGKDTTAASQGNFAWYQGLKMALFDVSDVNNPVQVANYVIGDRGTDSVVLNDPKAFLFDKTKDLLVIPVNLAMVNQTSHQQYPSDVPAYGNLVWQGAYVFSISTNGNFTLRGTVTHLNGNLLNSQGQVTNINDYYTSQNQWITRSLYIGNTLYTISNSEVKLNSLSDLAQIGQVNLQ
jgi:inhibitor of cysteine peptidase